MTNLLITEYIIQDALSCDQKPETFLKIAFLYGKQQCVTEGWLKHSINCDPQLFDLVVRDIIERLAITNPMKGWT